jgi:hypothetical protein
VSVSVVILNWNRPVWLRRVILPLLARHPLVDEIQVSHGREPACFSYKSRHCDIIHRRDWRLNDRYGLALRFVAAREAKNEAVLIVDDDLVVLPRSITSLKSFFDQAPFTLHGLFGRRIGPDYEYSYEGWERGETPIVLTRCLMMHRSYADVFLEAEPSAAELIKRGLPKWNGEDIFLSLLSIRESGTLPRAYDLPFKNVWRMHRGSISRTEAPQSDPEKMDHRSYRTWFTREAVELLGVQAHLEPYLKRSNADS